MDGFVQLGELSADANAAVGAEGLDEVIEEFADTVAGLVNDDGVVERALCFEEPFACSALWCEKADIQEAVARQSG